MQKARTICFVFAGHWLIASLISSAVPGWCQQKYDRWACPAYQIHGIAVYAGVQQVCGTSAADCWDIASDCEDDFLQMNRPGNKRTGVRFTSVHSNISSTTQSHVYLRHCW